MKKFNQMESNLITDALNYYVANLEAEIKKMETKELKKEMTKKQKQYE